MQEAQSVWRDFVTSKGIACIGRWLEGKLWEDVGCEIIENWQQKEDGADKRSCLCEHAVVRQRLPRL